MAIGAKDKNIIDAQAKNLILTPASHATITPPAAIKRAVPRSGWVTTNNAGAISTTIGKNKNFILFTSVVGMEEEDESWINEDGKIQDDDNDSVVEDREEDAHLIIIYDHKHHRNASSS